MYMDSDLLARRAERVQAARRLKNWNQEQLAAAIGVSTATVRNIEQARSSPRPPVLKNLARVLGTTQEVLDAPRPAVVADAHGVAPRAVGNVIFPAIPLVEIPIWGSVPAGYPDMREAHIEGLLLVPATVATPDSFALRIQGDSMVGAGIADGDLAIVRPVDSPEQVYDGEAVIAGRHGEFTCKFLHRIGERVELRPANAAYRPIPVLDDDWRIIGVVMGIQRSVARNRGPLAVSGAATAKA